MVPLKRRTFKGTDPSSMITEESLDEKNLASMLTLVRAKDKIRMRVKSFPLFGLTTSPSENRYRRVMPRTASRVKKEERDSKFEEVSR